MPDMLAMYGPDQALRMGKDGRYDVTAGASQDAAAAWIRQQEQEIESMFVFVCVFCGTKWRI